MRVKRSVRPKASARPRVAGKSARPARSRKPSGLDSPFATGAIALVVICVVGVVMLVAARDTSEPADATLPSTIVEQPAPEAKVATPTKAAPTFSKAAPANTAVPKAVDAPSGKAAPTLAKAAPANTPVPKAVDAPPDKAAATLATVAPANAPVPKAVDAPPATPSATVSPIVTFTGCLDRAGEGLRLKDTSGENAPKSRSWKSGFLKKGSAPIAVVDATSAREVPDHVGQRVSVTGVLTDRNMRVFSLRRLAASCR